MVFGDPQQHSNLPNPRGYLLRTCREGPNSRCATETCDEVASLTQKSLHRITPTSQSLRGLLTD
jgi:hypothetical protein